MDISPMGAPLPTLLASRTDSKVTQPPAEDVDKKQMIRLRPLVAPLEDLPLEMASDFCVRNTFIDTPVMLSPSLQGFYRQREVKTCPSNAAGRLLHGGLLQDAPWL